MTPERWRRIRPILDRALELQGEERTAFLLDRCGDDARLRTDVEDLLRADAHGALPLDAPVGEYAGALVAELAETPPSAIVGRRVGPYRPVREIGRGGMGAVYLAERADGHFDQRVALKLLASGLQPAEHEGRLRAERQILAGLDHPNIARLLDGGATSDGRPFLVMEYIDGVPISRYCDEHRLGIGRRLSLFLRVCDAVEYAHGKQIIHRDLKPANILVTVDGQVKLLDFGIAKLLDPEPGALAAALTRTGMWPMTPEYASPEQVRNDPITTASDVYQLGLLLFEVLTGQQPYRIDTRSPAEVPRVICEQSPPRPSAVVRRSLPADTERILLARGTTAKRLEKALHGDLDAIVLIALRKEPEHRFGSARDLAEDIRRQMSGRPVRARGRARGYRVRTFIRRHRWQAGVAAAFTLLLSGSAVTVTVRTDGARAVPEPAASETSTIGAAEGRVPVSVPPGWAFGNTSLPFQIGLDFDNARSGNAAAYLTWTRAEPASADDFASLGQFVLANAYRGQRIRLTAWVRHRSVEGIAASEIECQDSRASQHSPRRSRRNRMGRRRPIECVGGGAGLWMRVDGPEAMVRFDDMLGGGRPLLGTNDNWQQHAIVLDVPDDAVGIAFGVMIDGARGDAIVDDFRLQIVDSNVESTNLLQSPVVYGNRERALMDYRGAPEAPANLGFEGM